MSHSDRQFKFRIPAVLSEALEQSARDNGRTLTAEILARLEVATLSTPAARIMSLLNQINQARPWEPVLPSILAEMIGETNAAAVESVVNGKDVASFSLLDRIAASLGATSAWLKHGTGSQFPITDQRCCDVPWAKNLVEIAPEKISFVRSRNEVGNLAVIIQMDAIRHSCINTGMHLSDHIGAGGETDLARFSNCCFWLSRYHGPISHGYLLEEATFRDLVSGQLYPGLAMKHATPSGWFHDWWDPSMFGSMKINEYWIGYRQFCRRVRATVSSNSALNEEHSQIIIGH